MWIAPKIRRRGHALSFAALCCAALGALAGGIVTAAAAPSDTVPQDMAALEALARSAAAAQLPPLSAQQRLVVGPLPNFQLERCTGVVRPVISPAHMKDRLMVELRCEGTTAWHLYVPVRLVGTSPATVAAHALVVGSVLTAADLRTEQHDLTELPPGYFDDPAVAIGLTAIRPIAGGTILTNQQLAGAKAVQHGQAVTLVADAGGMSVRMAGRALSDGLINQRVRVQNLSSGKVVEGVARSAQVVEIISQ